MDDDFPAAHSHNVTWFAVDASGHVAMFQSGTLGHSPKNAENADLAAELWRFSRPVEVAETSFQRQEERALQLGFFSYAYGHKIHSFLRWPPSLAPYHRVAGPDAPLHVDQLPPHLRERCKRIRFELVDFARCPSLQPLEQYACDYRYLEERVAYLCSDGKTVRPIPGREAEFADFCIQFWEEHPEEAKKLVFEWPEK